MKASLASLDAHLRANSTVPTGSTPYHSSVIPPTPLGDFAHFLCARTHYDGAGLAVALALLARRCASPAAPPLCALSMHRVLLACIVVGAKTNFDRFVQNRYVAELCGMEPRELCYLERTLLDELDWRAMPTAAEVAGAPQVLRIYTSSFTPGTWCDGWLMTSRVHAESNAE